MFPDWLWGGLVCFSLFDFIVKVIFLQVVRPSLGCQSLFSESWRASLMWSEWLSKVSVVLEEGLVFVWSGPLCVWKALVSVGGRSSWFVRRLWSLRGDKSTPRDSFSLTVKNGLFRCPLSIINDLRLSFLVFTSGENDCNNRRRIFFHISHQFLFLPSSFILDWLQPRSHLHHLYCFCTLTPSFLLPPKIMQHKSDCNLLAQCQCVLQWLHHCLIICWETWLIISKNSLQALK